MNRGKILVVDDDDSLRRGQEQLLHEFQLRHHLPQQEKDSDAEDADIKIDAARRGAAKAGQRMPDRRLGIDRR